MAPDSGHYLGEYDIICSAGLYDYLDNRICKLLTGKIYKQLKPGGRIVIGNFSPAANTRSFLDLIMDWALIYKNKEELESIAPPGSKVMMAITSFYPLNGFQALGVAASSACIYVAVIGLFGGGFDNPILLIENSIFLFGAAILNAIAKEGNHRNLYSTNLRKELLRIGNIRRERIIMEKSHHTSLGKVNFGDVAVNP